MKVLFIGGTGVISTDVVRRCLDKGMETVLLNRGNHPLPEGVRGITADINDEAAAAAALQGENFDTVCEFVAYTPAQIERDIRLFREKTRQYIFISSASAYAKPVPHYPITEETPLTNPFWDYSRKKAACEEVLKKAYAEEKFPFTVVRPSHTYCEHSVPTAMHGKNGCWQVLQRILDGKEVIIPGDGSSLWTTTFSTDFAKGFTGLIGNQAAVGEAYHITTDETMQWQQIYETIAAALQRELKCVHIATDYLTARQENYNFYGELYGDKSVSVLFDNSKIKKAVPEFVCTISMRDGISRSVRYMASHPAYQIPDPDFDKWCDRIIREYKD